jgi:hypothetical protein
MSETKFTKGPWVIDSKYSTFLAVSANSVVVCDVSCCHDGYHIKPSSEELANARLISCAPDMYKAIEELIEMFEAEVFERYGETGLSDDDVAEYKQLLKRARGE